MSELFRACTEMNDMKFVTTRAKQRRLNGGRHTKRHSGKTAVKVSAECRGTLFKECLCPTDIFARSIRESVIVGYAL